MATPAQQDEAALRTLQAEGTGPWSESRPCWNSPDIAPNYATAAPPSTPAPTTTVPEDGEATATVPEDGEQTTTTVPTDTTVAEPATTTAPDEETTTTTVP